MNKKKKGKTKTAGGPDAGVQNGAERKQKHGTMENLLYWLKALYREAPGFVWLYLAGIGSAIGISLLGIHAIGIGGGHHPRGNREKHTG